MPASEAEQKDDDEDVVGLTLDLSLDWDATDDIFPLMGSSHRGTRRLGAFLTAQLVTGGAEAQLTPKVQELLAAVVADEAGDALAARFAKLSVQKQWE